MASTNLLGKTKIKLNKKHFIPKKPLAILEFLNPQLLHLSQPQKPQTANVLNV